MQYYVSGITAAGVAAFGLSLFKAIILILTRSTNIPAHYSFGYYSVTPGGSSTVIYYHLLSVTITYCQLLSVTVNRYQLLSRLWRDLLF